MPYTENYPLGANGDLLQDIIRRLEVLEARGRQIQNGAISFVDSSGNQIVVIGQLADGTYGMEVFDTHGNVVVKLGELLASPALYGLEVSQVIGASTQQALCQVTPAIGQPPTAVTNTAATAWTNFSSGSITASVSSSGIAVVTVQGDVSTSGVNVQGNLGFTVDGGATHFAAALSSAGGAVQASIGATQGVVSLSPGSHTFQMQYQVVNPGTASFNAPLLIVQPL